MPDLPSYPGCPAGPVRPGEEQKKGGSGEADEWCLLVQLLWGRSPLWIAPNIKGLTESVKIFTHIDGFWKLGWLTHKSALCTRIALLPVRSKIDLKVPQKLIDVTNISISTENRISKSVYWGERRSGRSTRTKCIRCTNDYNLHPLYPKIHMAELLCDVPDNPIFFHFLPSRPLFYWLMLI